MPARAVQDFAIVGTIDPASMSAGTVTTDIVDASLYDKVVFIFQCGTVSSCTGKIVFTIYEGTVTGTVSTSLDTLTWNASSSADEDRQWLIEVPGEALGTNYRYLKGRAVYSGGTGAGISALVLGMKPRFHPGYDGDLATVETIIYST